MQSLFIVNYLGSVDTQNYKCYDFYLIHADTAMYFNRYFTLITYLFSQPQTKGKSYLKCSLKRIIYSNDIG